MPSSILIADDHAVVRHGIAILVKEIIPDACIFHANDFNSLLKELGHNKVNLAICDVNMPGCNSFHMIDIIKNIQPEIRTLIFSAYKEELYAKRFMMAGADAYLHKDTESDGIKATILSIINKNVSYRNVVADHTHYGSRKNFLNPITMLSNRELEVANLLVKGLGVLEICNTLQLNKTTVSTYKSRIYEKMNISTIPELVTIFRNHASVII